MNLERKLKTMSKTTNEEKQESKLNNCCGKRVVNRKKIKPKRVIRKYKTPS